MAGWRDVHVGEQGDRVRIGGVEVWRHEWRWLDAATIYLPHPFDRSQMCRFMLCEAGPPRGRVRFAAGKLPNDLWAFYVND